MSRRKKKSNNANCETCFNCIPIGEGDHICDECGGESVLVISDYIPTDDYLKCGGHYYED